MEAILPYRLPIPSFLHLYCPSHLPPGLFAMVKISIAPEKSRSDKASYKPFGIALGVVGVAIVAWSVAQRPQPQVQVLSKGLNAIVMMPKTIESEAWQTEKIGRGVTGYHAPEDTGLEYSISDVTEIEGTLDGTRYPYVTDVHYTDLVAVPDRPGQYVWNGIWEGEGYNRVWDSSHRLVAEREPGVDVYLNVKLDQTIKDPQTPNLIITVENAQDQTAQLTNLSAFWIDRETGETLERKDFEQLPPVYEVTVSRNGGYGGTETKILQRLGTVTFAYHVSPEQMQQPLRLAGVNRSFAQRQQEIYDLQTQGWIVKEVPAAGDVE
jgi:hypothetical protein